MNKEILHRLCYVQENLSLEILQKIYDEDMASHLWNKFIYFDSNLLLWISYLDKHNKHIFIENINNDNIF
jgi:hypothetical protein